MSDQRSIPFKEAKQLFETFKNSAADKGQTLQVYFKYEGLMEYLTSIAKAVDPTEISKLGIKVYLGQYPKDYPEAKKRGRNTVFFVPCIETEENGKIVNQDMLANLNNNKLAGFAIEAYNHGTACPPYDDVSPTGEPICSGTDF